MGEDKHLILVLKQVSSSTCKYYTGQGPVYITYFKHTACVGTSRSILTTVTAADDFDDSDFSDLEVTHLT